MTTAYHPLSFSFSSSISSVLRLDRVQFYSRWFSVSFVAVFFFFCDDEEDDDHDHVCS